LRSARLGVFLRFNCLINCHNLNVNELPEFTKQISAITASAKGA